MNDLSGVTVCKEKNVSSPLFSLQTMIHCNAHCHISSHCPYFEAAFADSPTPSLMLNGASKISWGISAIMLFTNSSCPLSAPGPSSHISQP